MCMFGCLQLANQLMSAHGKLKLLLVANCLRKHKSSSCQLGEQLVAGLLRQQSTSVAPFGSGFDQPAIGASDGGATTAYICL